ncbi:glycoside hydrolase family 53 protein [Niveibacterium umoris]|uniref:Arabinogalactan endo-beta-1,4-galactanase n=1 Tax=Niveibacterium umoris TaxID=1193620 RepID=A0A840BNS2_9RHOO|nr:glycosyl hydrolase 53 family protein [Niveibacterium umoris]MBB4013139.1 arabinogalactan endo-1,4-beta-galactosidase [Niveibacterium umoris]
MKIRKLLLGGLLACLVVPCMAATFAKGADVSWVSQEEAAGYKFYNSSGVATDPFVLLKGIGVNAIRLRVWVNPGDGWNNGADVLYKAKRAAAQGMRIMIDFHYSDTWADPAHQTKPAAWTSHGYADLKTDVYNHTWGILNYLKTNGITVEWVQVGNEINSGMLWPEGSTSNFTQLAGLINQGYAAAKAVYPGSLVVLHLANGYNNTVFRWFFDGVKAAGAKWDVIGMSHYPAAASWSSYNTQLATNMSDMVSRYAKPVIISEVGMDWQQAATAKSMLADLMAKVQALGSNGLGVFYWEPEAYPGWQGYTMGALNGSGQFTQALDPY